ncbi:MAG: methionine adenosyltransferase [Chloroflexi bacterium]|nr:methionine adenosyltransferase [Chloroflexota bacterium]
MSNTFMQAPRLLFTSESVTEGHPDKLCDQVSDAVLDAFLAADPESRVACEAATTTGLVLVLGEITSKAPVDVRRVVRDTVREIGYTASEFGFDGETCGVTVALNEQSADIKQGVDEALEVRALDGDYDDVEALGAGDQGMMYGFACDETPELMPAPIALAHRAARRLAQVRKDGTLAWLRPDGKSQVTVEYRHGQPARVDCVVVAAQHDPDIGNDAIERAIEESVIREAIPGDLLDADTRIIVNGTGRFVVGGPMGDAGLTGRKIIVDTYGGMARHGGGAFSGKDPTKVDRSANYALRWIAKNVVAAGLATRFEVQAAYVIGKAEPLSLNIETYGTSTVPDDRIEAAIRDTFDLRPGAIIRDLDLRRPLYRQVAAYGHFGRDDLDDIPWEQTNRAPELARLVGR